MSIRLPSLQTDFESEATYCNCMSLDNFPCLTIHSKLHLASTFRTSFVNTIRAKLHRLVSIQMSWTLTSKVVVSEVGPLISIGEARI